MKLDELDIYQKSKQISKYSWEIYSKFDFNTKMVIGNQWIKSIDSVGANIAEGFGRYHYLDKNKFNYNARGSLLEAIYWTQLLEERKLINSDEIAHLTLEFDELHPKLNKYISITKQQITK